MKTPEDDPTSIGNILIRMGYVTNEQVQKVKEEQARMREDLLMGNLMVAKGWITRSQLDTALSAQRNMRSGKKRDEALAMASISLESTSNDKKRRDSLLEKGQRMEKLFDQALPLVKRI